MEKKKKILIGVLCGILALLLLAMPFLSTCQKEKQNTLDTDKTVEPGPYPQIPGIPGRDGENSAPESSILDVSQLGHDKAPKILSVEIEYYKGEESGWEEN